MEINRTLKIELTEKEYKFFNTMLEKYKEMLGEGMFEDMLNKNPYKAYGALLKHIKEWQINWQIKTMTGKDFLTLLLVNYGFKEIEIKNI